MFFREHSQHLDVNLADLTVGALAFQTSMIGGQRESSIDGHELEIVRVRSDPRRRMRRALRGNHLPLALDLTFRRYLEKLTRPILISEFDAFLIVLVIRTSAGAAQPLLVSVPQLLLQCGTVFILADRSFLGGFLPQHAGCTRQKDRHGKYTSSKGTFPLTPPCMTRCSYIYKLSHT